MRPHRPTPTKAWHWVVLSAVLLALAFLRSGRAELRGYDLDASHIHAHLDAASDVDAQRLAVHLSGSVVTLAGTVPDPAVKDRALTLVAGLHGVARVVDDVRVEAAHR